MRILHLEKSCYDAESLKKLEEVGEVSYHDFQSLEELQLHLHDNYYEVIFTKLGLAIGPDEIKLQPDLKYIITPTTGLNHIDLTCAAGKDIKVISLKGEDDFLSQVKSTAEHTWMLLLSLIRNLVPAQKDVKQGNWNRSPHLADELNTKTIGIIGLGRLGKILVNYAEAFNMNILCNDIDETVFTDTYKRYKASLHELLTKSDYVILQVDYRPENQHFFDETKFSLMKEESYFINTSRGEIVDETELLKRLNSGKLKGAALDVMDGDSSWGSKVEQRPLLHYSKKHKNLIITPHMGGYGRISIEMTRAFVTDKFLKSILL